MENLVIKNMFNGIYKDKTVFVTGHTGFKGAWLVYWLSQMGSKVIGYSLNAPTNPNHIGLLNLDINSVIGDIRCFDKLNHALKISKPDIVFHLAAQALVRTSYKNPIETYETNVLGTLNVLEACRINDIKAIVNVTSDKVYDNKEWIWGYRENDPIGGYDPYSSSKGCADLLASSYRNSYFNIKDYNKTHNTLLATCRAGNVIGGGDWAEDRLIPDIILSTLNGKKVKIRNPKSTRPWEHVLEPLSGYLHIGQKLLEEKIEFAQAWNFGPNNTIDITVEEVVKKMQKYWNKIDYEVNIAENQPHEANLLKLDCSKANTLLKWQNVWSNEVTFKKTIEWYKAYYENNGAVLTENDLKSYIADAKIKNIEWAFS